MLQYLFWTHLLSLMALGVPVYVLNMSKRWPSPLAIVWLVRIIRRIKPDVVQTWMYHGDLIGGLAARVAGSRSIVWGIRHTTLEQGRSKRLTIWIAKLLGKLSWCVPSKIVVCANRAMDVHEALGYDRRKMHLVSNGYDLSEFRPGLDPPGELKSMQENVKTLPLIGTVGRFDPQKDHRNLLDALAIMRDRGHDFLCILVGKGLNASNVQIVDWIAQRRLTNHVRMLGSRDDIPKIMNALDLHVLPSAFGEAFPNVVAEAMACGTPCLVTDVGDAAYIVGDTGWVVPPADHIALAEEIIAALQEVSDPDMSEQRSSRARRRIEESFSIERMVASYDHCWRSVVE